MCAFHLKLLDVEGLDTKAHSLPRDSKINLGSLVVNRFNYNWVEFPVLVGPKEQLSVGEDSTSFEGTGNNDTDTSDMVDAINEELDWLCGWLKVPADPYSRLKHRKELLQFWQALTGHI